MKYELRQVKSKYKIYNTTTNTLLFVTYDLSKAVKMIAMYRA